jgi:hypothetical protein
LQNPPVPADIVRNGFTKKPDVVEFRGVEEAFRMIEFGA